ncbi:MAG TPA: hypothetical protein EYO87_10120, partial [Paracoccus sp.]|nr:hypothetical protein [Paracoccus sp. (in: a-proteobacteria)]
MKDDAGLELTARFTVSRNDARRGVTVRLPLTGGNLGPDACRVNGLRHPVSRSPDGLGLLVELPARPTTAAVPAAGRVDEIVFDLHPVVRRTGGGRTIQLGIPPVLDSRVELTLPAGFPKLVVPDIHDHTAAGRHVVPLSWTNRLELTWLPSGASRAPGAKVSAQVLGRIDLHPLRRKVDYRVRVQVESGGIDFVTLTLPGGVVVDAGDVAADDVLAVSVLPIAEDRRRIVVEFTGPRSGEFEIRVSGRRPRSDSADSVIQLKPNLVLSHGTPATVVPIRETVIGVTPAPGFQLIQIGLLPTGTKTVDPAEFAGLWV